MVDSRNTGCSNQLEEIKALITNSKQELQTAIKQLSATIDNLHKTVTDLRGQNCNLERRLEGLERQSRKNNIIVFGLENTNHRNTELANWIISKLESLLEVTVSLQEINNVYYIGKHDSPNRPVIVQFSSYLTKIKIFKNLFKLKGKNISISHDLSPEDRKINKVLVSNLKEAKSKKLAAYIKGNKLHIGEEVYSYQQLIDRKPIIAESTNNGNITDDDVFTAIPTRLSFSAAHIENTSHAAPPVNQNTDSVVADRSTSVAALPASNTAGTGCTGGSNSHNNSTSKNKTSGTPTTHTRTRSTRLQGQPKK